MKVRVPPSVALGDEIASVGVGSSSAMVPVAVAVPRAAFTASESVTTTVSSASSRASPVTVTSMVPPLAPGGMVSVPAASAV